MNSNKEFEIFDSQGLKELKNYLKNVKRTLKSSLVEIVDETLKEGKQKAIENANQFVVGDGQYNDELSEAVNGLKYEILSKRGSKVTGEIRNNTEYGTYAEFGTGMTGKGSPHMYYDGKWAYEVNPNRDYTKGWWYSTDGVKKHTHGIPAGNYLYRTKWELEKIFSKHTEEILRKKGVI